MRRGRMRRSESDGAQISEPSGERSSTSITWYGPVSSCQHIARDWTQHSSQRRRRSIASNGRTTHGGRRRRTHRHGVFIAVVERYDDAVEPPSIYIILALVADHKLVLLRRLFSAFFSPIFLWRRETASIDGGRLALSTAGSFAPFDRRVRGDSIRLSLRGAYAKGSPRVTPRVAVPQTQQVHGPVWQVNPISQSRFDVAFSKLRTAPGQDSSLQTRNRAAAT